MVFFAVCVLAWIGAALTSTRQRDGFSLAILLIVAFLASLMPGLLVDASEGTSVKTIGLELQPLLFWLTAPFFAMALRDIGAVRKSASIIIFGGLAVAAVTVAITIGLQLGLVPFGSVYLWADRTDELFFRGRSNFFYKGHFYVAIALVFCIVLTPRWWKSFLLLLMLSLAFSLTRGLYLGVVIAVALSFISARRSLAVIILVVAATLFAVLYGHLLIDLIFDPNRTASSQTRSRDLTYFIATFDYRTLLLGDGTGALLNGRQTIENSLIWALWRFGFVGLAFWLSPLALSMRYFYRIPFRSENHKLASAFFFGMVMLYVVTNTNPFINNSIGITYALCAIFSLRRLSQKAAGETPAMRLNEIMT